MVVRPKVKGVICPDCRSKNIHRFGHTKQRVKGTTKVIKVQRYRCYNCLHQFSKKEGGN